MYTENNKNDKCPDQRAGNDESGDPNVPLKTSKESTLYFKPHFVKVMALSCEKDDASFRRPPSTVIHSMLPPQEINEINSQKPPPVEETKTFTLEQFVQNFTNMLPVEIMITEGADSLSPVPLNKEDILQVQRINYKSMVQIRANENQHYLIPINAAIEFCVVYDPENNISKALKGYSFEKVGDIISAEVRPKLVCARSSWEDKDTGKVVISNREVFVVGDIVMPPKKKGKKLMRLYSIMKQTEKVLSEECVANFSTKPSLLPLYLTEITGYIRDPFPCKVVLHDEGLMVPPHLCNLITSLSGLVLTMASMNTEQVLETTYRREGIENSVVMDIPLKLPQVKVRVLNTVVCHRESELDHASVEDSDSRGTENSENIKTPTDKKANKGLISTEEGYELMARADITSCIRGSLVLGQPNLLSQIKMAATTIRRTHSSLEELTPRQFAEQYKYALPVQVRIAECSQSTRDDGPILDEVYNVHLLTPTDGVSMMDNKGILVLVPRDSSMQFGVVYNPYDDFEAAVRGYVYESIDNVAGLARLPPVLCAIRTCELPAGPSASVSANEILIVSGTDVVIHTGSVSLLVYSITEGTTKRLPAECKGCFSTEPSRVALHVTDILHYMPTILPTCAVMYPGYGGDSSIISGPVTVRLLQYHQQSVLVATVVDSPKNNWNPYQPVEISLDAEIMVVALPNASTRPINTAGSSECDGRSSNVQGLPLLSAPCSYEAKTLTYVDDAEQDRATSAPVERTDIAGPPPIVPRRGQGEKARGNKKDAAPSLSPSSSNGAVARHYREEQSAVSVERAPFGRKLRNSQQLAVGGQQERAELNNTSNNKGTTGGMPSRKVSAGEDTSSLQDVPDASTNTTTLERVERIDHSVAVLASQLAALTKRVGDIEEKLDVLSNLLRMRRQDTEDNEQRKYLRSLTGYEVLQLLNTLGLGMYSEAFGRENIDGQLLCMLNEPALLQDLKVSSALHRLKLLGIISGTVDLRGRNA